MPPRKYTRLPKRRRIGRKRRPTAYKGKRTALYRSVAGTSHLFKRMGQPIVIQNIGTAPPTIAPTTTGFQIGSALAGNFPGTCDFPLSANFRLKDVQVPSDFTNLFDRYKLVGVKLKFLYQMYTSSDQADYSSGVSGTLPLPIMDYSYDADDSEVPISRAEVQVKAYAKTKILTANSPWKTYYTPRVDKAVYNAGLVSTAFTSERACWIDCNNNDVQHYGFKAWISSFPWDTTVYPGKQGGHGMLTIQPIYYIAMRDSQ